MFFIDSLDEKFKDSFAWGIVKPQLKVAIRQNGEAIRRQVIVEGKSIKQCCLNALGFLIFRQLAYGNEHVYRGVLSMHGTALKGLFHKVAQEQLKAGAISPEQAAANLAELDAAIKDAG